MRNLQEITVLPGEIRAYIVSRLACYETPTRVAQMVKEEFDIDLKPSHVHTYDPTKVAGKDLAKDLKELFYKIRDEFISDTSGIPISQKSYRLAALQRMHAETERIKNYALSAQLLEQAAKEMGEQYTNKSKLEHTSPDGSMTPRPLDMTKLPPEALEAIVKAGDAATDDK